MLWGGGPWRTVPLSEGTEGSCQTQGLSLLVVTPSTRLRSVCLPPRGGDFPPPPPPVPRDMEVEESVCPLGWGSLPVSGMTRSAPCQRDLWQPWTSGHSPGCHSVARGLLLRGRVDSLCHLKERPRPPDGLQRCLAQAGCSLGSFTASALEGQPPRKTQH